MYEQGHAIANASTLHGIPGLDLMIHVNPFLFHET